MAGFTMLMPPCMLCWVTSTEGKKKKKNPHHSNDTSYILGFSVPTTGGTPSLIEAPP